MAGLKIKTETFATRCEICHQADYYDPVRNFCGRCTGVGDLLELQANYLQLRDRLVAMRRMLVADGAYTSEPADPVGRRRYPAFISVPLKVFATIFSGFLMLAIFVAFFALVKVTFGLALMFLLIVTAGGAMVAAGVSLTVFVILSGVTILKWTLDKFFSGRRI